ncbi:cystathionine gamma-synthase [Actinokineospora alba]|uniref:Cystathionine gamma-synthase n=1 Tax=Actinokineospora alba TaxID=504798 RepID=A0A1H0RUV2_9PSEU|nr:cystathionine gamma-synthase [Actinokineospora alba]TDP66902.1 cystathionine gamma-synthase [Actinokineospora alba]SDJ34368.1 cystathionine gamma-synthase [Actinokineospora alba]SDP33361.1 cystathionine gamma-synthase [Actinokineospora alba]
MADDSARWGFETRAIHAGQDPDPRTGAVIVPIYQTSTFAQDGVGGLREGYEYSRTANPTRTALETALASLEGGAHGLAFASGMAASDVALRSMTRPGDHVILGNDAYGGTFRLIDKVMTLWGVEYSAVDLSDLDATRAALRPTTKVIWSETPTNPLLGIADIAALAAIATEGGAKLVIDNTFATPYLQAPLSLGADVVLHSTTKYLGGHSDVVGGALVTSDSELNDQFAFLRNAAGAVPGPFDSWLTLRGAKTLALRMERHSDNAERIVETLLRSDKISKVYYPGLSDHPGHEIAAKQMRRFGGMISFSVAGGEQAALDLVSRTKLFTLGESLGGIESLIEHPGRMTHASTAGSPLQVPADLVRLSVGIEDSTDLIQDLVSAL